MKKFIEPSSILMIDIETLDTTVTAQVVEVAMLYKQSRVSREKLQRLKMENDICPKG